MWPGAWRPGECWPHLQPDRVLPGRGSCRRDSWKFGEIRHSERILLGFVQVWGHRLVVGEIFVFSGHAYRNISVRHGMLSAICCDVLQHKEVE